MIDATSVKKVHGLIHRISIFSFRKLSTVQMQIVRPLQCEVKARIFILPMAAAKRWGARLRRNGHRIVVATNPCLLPTRIFGGERRAHEKIFRGIVKCSSENQQRCTLGSRGARWRWRASPRQQSLASQQGWRHCPRPGLPSHFVRDEALSPRHRRPMLVLFYVTPTSTTLTNVPGEDPRTFAELPAVLSILRTARFSATRECGPWRCVTAQSFCWLYGPPSGRTGASGVPPPETRKDSARRHSRGQEEQGCGSVSASVISGLSICRTTRIVPSLFPPRPLRGGISFGNTS